MSSDRHLDKKRAVENVAAGFQGLAYLPFITDEENARLFGEEVAAALLQLEVFNGRESLCRGCLNRCCRLVNCEFYSPELTRCPVQPYRPPLCRMHFCDRFAAQYPQLVKDLGDIFLDGLQAVGRLDSQTADLFDSPVLSPLVPGLVGSVLPLLAAAREGRTDEASALVLIQKEIEKYFSKSR
jgi:hypothetical protein